MNGFPTSFLIVVALLLAGCAEPEPLPPENYKEEDSYERSYSFQQEDLLVLALEPLDGANCRYQSTLKGGFATPSGLLSYNSMFEGNSTAVATRGEPLRMYSGGSSSSDLVWDVAAPMGFTWGTGMGNLNISGPARAVFSGFDIQEGNLTLDCPATPRSMQLYRAEQFAPISSADSPGVGIQLSEPYTRLFVERTSDWTVSLQETQGPVILRLHSRSVDWTGGATYEAGTVTIDSPQDREVVPLEDADMTLTRIWDAPGTYSVTIDRTAVGRFPLFGILAELELVESVGEVLPLDPSVDQDDDA